MNKSILYHIGCAVCVGTERELLKLMDKSQIDVVNLVVKKDKIEEAKAAGVKSVPALVTRTGAVLHVNSVADLDDL